MKIIRNNNDTKNIVERINCLNRLREELTKEYAQMPEGALLVSPGTTKNSYRYYLRENSKDKFGTYLDKSRSADKQKFARKKYLKELLKNIDVEVSKLEKIQKIQVTDSIINTYKSLNPGIKRFVEPIDVDDETYKDMWLQKHYVGLGFDEKDKTSFYSDKGERMRSKSEVLIANALNKANVAYKYECPVTRKNGELLYPDFTILDTKRRRNVYWEHLGKMDDMSYVSRNLWKLEEYKGINIQIGINLFLTHESSMNPLGTKEINNIIQWLLYD